MKQNQRGGKLQLKKQVVSNLTNAELEKVEGGKEAAFTTSRIRCSGFLCCVPFSEACPTDTSQFCTNTL